MGDIYDVMAAQNLMTAMQQQSDAVFAWQLTDITRIRYMLFSIGNHRVYLPQNQLIVIYCNRQNNVQGKL